MTSAWQDYQEEAAAFFRALKMDVQTNVPLKGVRTTHNVDVLVKSCHVGFEVTWIVECKCWQTPVSKLHVLALREIVSETGADRGILLSESGFQMGAKEAAALTNVHLRSLAESANEVQSELTAMRLVELNDRVNKCHSLYWGLPKSLRIDYGLRPPGGMGEGYLGDAVIKLVEDTLLKAFRKSYPFETNYMWRVGFARGFPEEFSSAEEVLTYVDPLLSELETKLTNCIRSLPADHPLRSPSWQVKP